MALILFKRGTRAALDAAAGADALHAGEPYLVSDEGVVAVGTDVDVYIDIATEASVSAAISALKATVYGVVNHGSTAGTSRPSGFAGIIWYGSVQPTNATGVDIVIRTDEGES